MSAPAAPEPSEPMRWFYPLIGLAFASLVIGSLAAATVYSYSDDPSAAHDDGHAEDTDHADTEDDGHAEDTDHADTEDDGHAEDTDHADTEDDGH